MRLGSFISEEGPGFGIFEDEQVIDVSHSPTTAGFGSLRRALEALGAEAVAEAARSSGRLHRLASVQLCPPFPDAERIICVGLNYYDHAQEAGISVPDKPSLFTRFRSSFVGSGEAIVKPSISDEFDFEGELALIIGKPGYRIAKETAFGHMLGLTLAADNSVRDWQNHSRQVTPGKNFPRSGALGPCCVTMDEVGDFEGLWLETRLNGRLVQRGSSSDLIFKPADLIAYISMFTPLDVGDVILLGTPAGVGMSRVPKLWLKPGDRLEVSVAGIGTLSSPVTTETNSQQEKYP